MLVLPICSTGVILVGAGYVEIAYISFTCFFTISFRKTTERVVSVPLTTNYK